MDEIRSHRIVEVDSIFGRIYAFENDLITDHLIHFGAHTRPELAFLLSVVDEGDAVFDLGAHIGTFALPLARRLGSKGRLLAVEGLEENWAVLKMNVRRSGLPASISVLNAALVPAGVQYKLLIQPNNTGDSFFAPTAGCGAERETTTIDELCGTYFSPRVMKLDLEGYEAFALQGAAKLLDSRPIIYAEVADALLQQTGSGVGPLGDFLRKLGYRLFKNVGPRNARNDAFKPIELDTLRNGGTFFDVLAVHCNDNRIARVCSSV